MYGHKATWCVCVFACVCRAQSVGSVILEQQQQPRTGRLSTTTAPTYATSSQGYYTYSTVTVPSSSRARKLSHTQAEVTASLGVGGVPGAGGNYSTLDPSSIHPSGANTSPWKRKLSQTMRHLVVSPRFHRKRYNSSSTDISSSAESPSPQV